MDAPVEKNIYLIYPATDDSILILLPIFARDRFCNKRNYNKKVSIWLKKQPFQNQ